MRPQKGATGLIGPGMYYQTHFKKLWIFSWLGLIEQIVIAQKLSQNGILQVSHKVIFESTWSSEDILFKRKIGFISQKTKLDSKVET